MTNPHRLDERALRRLDDVQLEVARLNLLRAGDERLEQVLELLLVRGIAHIERVSRELCDLHGLSDQQHQEVVVDAMVRLQLRLTRQAPLASVPTLATQLAGECIAARTRAPQSPEGRPRLAARAPQLRAMPALISNEVRLGRLKSKGEPNS